MKPLQVLPHQVKVDQRVKEYSIQPRSSELEPHHQIQFSVTPKTLFFRGKGLTSLQRIWSVYSKPRWQSTSLNDQVKKQTSLLDNKKLYYYVNHIFRISTHKKKGTYMEINVCNSILHIFKSKKPNSNDIIRIIQKTQMHQNEIITFLKRKCQTINIQLV